MADNPIARYFASLKFKVEKSEIKKVDDFLNKISKGLEQAGKQANNVDKSNAKVKKSTDEATKAVKQQLTWQEKLNKFKQGELKLNLAIAQNQKALSKSFKQSVDAMVIKPSTAKKLKDQQAIYDSLFGAIQPKASRRMIGASGANQSAWDRQFKQQIRNLTTQSSASRRARQADLESVFGVQSNPKMASMLNSRLGYLSGNKNETLRSMAEYYKNEQRVAKLKTDAQKEVEASEKRILAARKRDIEQRIRNQQRMANWERKQQLQNAEWDRRERIRRRDRLESVQGRSRASYSRANFLHAGGAAGALSRYGMEALPFIGGAMGMAALNRRNQEIISANFGAKAILGEQGGAQGMEWLKSEADRIGFNWLDMAPEFTGFMGAASPLMGKDASLNTFKAFNEFAATRHAPAIARKRALMALKQMASKGTIMSEELFLQLGEAQGFTELPMVFAEAYQQRIGGNKKGADAMAALKQAMKEGKVKTSDILPSVSTRMSAMAAPTLAVSSKSSQAEQERFRNALNNQVERAGKGGVEEGFAKIFRTMSEALKEANPLVDGLAEAFHHLTIGLEAPRDLFKDLNTTLKEFSDTTGVSKGNIVELAGLGVLLATKWGRVAAIFAAIGVVMQDISYGIKGKESYTKDVMDFFGTSPTTKDGGEGMKTPAGHLATGLKLGAPFAIRGPVPFAIGVLGGTAASILNPSKSNTGPTNTPLSEIVAANKRSQDYRSYLMGSGMFNPDGTPASSYSFEKLQQWQNANPFGASGNNTINVTVQAVPGREIDAEQTGNVLATKLNEALQFFNKK